MMMMITPNSLVLQKEMIQGEKQEEKEGRRKAGSRRTPTPGANVPTCPTWSMVRGVGYEE